MHIIKIAPSEEGIYNDFMSEEDVAIPNGWAIIPDDFVKPSTFPRLSEIKVEEKAYPYEVEVEKEVVKTREVPQYDENGNLLEDVVIEEYTEIETVTETREKIIMTVTKMTEGTLPEPVEPEPTNDELQWQAITDLEIRQMEQDQAITDLEIAQLEGGVE